MWQIVFDQGKFDIRPCSELLKGKSAAIALDGIPENIYRSSVFFGSSPLSGSPASANQLALDLAMQLERSANFQNSAWFDWISDAKQVGANRASWLSMDGLEQTLRGPARDKTALSQTSVALAYIFWKGLYLYLRTGERWQLHNARFLILLSAWQWFHITRYLAKHWLACEIKNALVRPLRRSLNNELIQAARIVQALIEDPGNQYAVRVLRHHIAGQTLKTDETPGRPKQVGASGFTKALISKGSRFTADELLMLGLVLEPLSSPVKPPDWTESDLQLFAGPGELYDPDSDMGKDPVFWEPGAKPCGGWMSGEFSWEQVQIHPAFRYQKNWGLRPYLKKIIAGWLLPRYDLDSAYQLAMLIKNAPVRPAGWKVTAPAVLFVVLMIAFGAWYSLSGNGLLATFPVIIPAVVVLLVGFVASYQLLSRLDSEAAPYLLLPRLLGGMVVGYSALVLQGDSLTLKNALFTGSPLLGWLLSALVILSVTAVGWWYLKNECQTRLGNAAIAWRRARFLLTVSLFASALLGLFAVALTTAMEWQSPTFSPSLQGPYLLGPVGLLDLRQYVLFVPLAALVGFITQFIFEDKSIAAPVWSDA